MPMSLDNDFNTNSTNGGTNGGNDEEQRKVVNLELLAAVEATNYDRVTLCLKKGADINTRTADGTTPLMKAVWKENPTMVRFLVQKNANILLRNTAGKNAFDLNNQTRVGSNKEQITDILLGGLPDLARKAPTVVEAVRIAEVHAAEQNNDTAAKQDGQIPPPGKRPGFTL